MHVHAHACLQVYMCRAYVLCAGGGKTVSGSTPTNTTNTTPMLVSVAWGAGASNVKS
jgi:hypothetical protein